MSILRENFSSFRVSVTNEWESRILRESSRGLCADIPSANEKGAVTSYPRMCTRARTFRCINKVQSGS